MSSDGFADVWIQFNPVALLEKMNNAQDNPRDMNFQEIINGIPNDDDKQYARTLFAVFLADYNDVDYDYSYLNYDNDSFNVLRMGNLSSYAEIKSSLFEKELKVFFDKYKDIIFEVSITEEINIDGLGLYKIENRNEDGEHFLVHSPSTITYNNFTKL